ncbi:MAG: two-component system, NarL family, nitrate/nitrite response regulator NarL [Chloroflexota bacterium]|nr:two-component system, NarL family, nitrate/nitrite response regulator NarL [Chloroflexota bacterium]
MLIVDDHRQVREGVRALLETEPALRVVGEAASGNEAVSVALVLRPDLIVLDHAMPGSQGLDVLQQLRLVVPEARVVMFTMSTGIRSQARLRGAEAVIAKDDLNGLLATLLRLARERVERPATQPPRAPASGHAWWRAGWARAALVLGLAALYAVSFVRLVDVFGIQATDFAILVVAAAGAVFGLRGGLVAAAVAVPLNLFLVGQAGLTLPGVGTISRIAIAIAIGAAVGRLRDVTVRAQAQTRSLAEMSVALQASDRRLLGLVENAPVLLVAIDTGGVIVDALGGGFGDHPMFSPERMRGQQAAVFYASNPKLLERLSRALSGESFSEHVEYDGFAYDVRFRPRHDSTGALVGTTAVLLNVTRPGPATERP